MNVPFSSVQSLVVSDSATPWTAARQALSITNSRSPPKVMSIELVLPSNHLILCHHLLLLPSIFPRIRVFSSELAFLLYIPQNIDRHCVCFSTPFFFFFSSRLNAAQFFWQFFTECDFFIAYTSSSLLILLCTSFHPVLLGYDESFMSVVLRVHHGVWAVYFCHH